MENTHISRRNFCKYLGLAGASFLLPGSVFSNTESGVKKAEKSILDNLEERLGKDSAWYTQTYKGKDKNHVVLLPDHHVLSKKQWYNEFAEVFNSVKNNVSAFGLEGVEENAENPLRSIYDMNKDYLGNMTEEQIKKQMGALWNLVLDSGLPVFGLENKRLYLTNLRIEKLNESFYSFINNNVLGEMLNEFSDELVGFREKIPITRISNSKGEIISEMPEFKKKYADSDNRGSFYDYLEKVNEFKREIIDQRSYYASRVLLDKNIDTGILYGALHMDEIKEGLRKYGRSYIEIGNKKLDKIMKLNQETKDILDSR